MVANYPHLVNDYTYCKVVTWWSIAPLNFSLQVVFVCLATTTITTFNCGAHEPTTYLIVVWRMDGHKNHPFIVGHHRPTLIEELFSTRAQPYSNPHRNTI